MWPSSACGRSTGSPEAENSHISFPGAFTGDLGPDGKPASTFRPDDPITSAETAKIIALALTK